MEGKIITNNNRRPVLYWHELTDKERKEFDYLDTEDGQQDATFFRYRGGCYDLGEFQATMQYAGGRGMWGNPDIPGWDGFHADSFFSGVVVRYPREEWGEIVTDFVVVGLYIC